jgi:hypothetical protein
MVQVPAEINRTATTELLPESEDVPSSQTAGVEVVMVTKRPVAVLSDVFLDKEVTVKLASP